LQPVVVRRYRESETYQVIDGAHRLRAAKKAGIKTIPCVVIEADNDEEAKLKTVMLNRLRGKFDAKELARLVKEFDADQTRNLLAFNEKERKDLLSLLNLEAPSVKAEWVSRPPLRVVIEFLTDEATEVEVEKVLMQVMKEQNIKTRGEALLFLCRFWAQMCSNAQQK